MSARSKTINDRTKRGEISKQERENRKARHSAIKRRQSARMSEFGL